MTIVRCIDLETTGLPSDDESAPKQGIMEYGYVDLDIESMRLVRPHGFSSLVDCGVPVSIEARAVHHISDGECVGQMGPTQACADLMDGPHELFCAHNVDHEKAFFGGGERKWLCTYKAALRVWPDAPGHKLQELRYFLDVDGDDDFDHKRAARSHRALDDAYVCAFVLRRILREAKLEDSLRWSSGPALLVMCWMKKHKGKTWQAVVRDHRDYAEWIVDKSDITDRDVRATVRYWLKKIPPPPR